VQNLAGATAKDVLTLFRSLPETIKLGLQDKTSSELLSGWDTDPTIIRIDATRDFTGGAENDQGYLLLGLAIKAGQVTMSCACQVAATMCIWRFPTIAWN